MLAGAAARIRPITALVATSSVPQSGNFGITGDIAASFLRVNGVEQKMGAGAVMLPTQRMARAARRSRRR